jgi:hypothetical protein
VFDPDKAPLAHAYFASLPEGLDSFVGCLAVKDAFEMLEPATRVGELTKLGFVDPAFATRVEACRGSSWIPETIFQCMALLVADRDGEAAYVDWSRESSHELYRRPLLRHLMRLLSPTLVVMGAASRWQAVRRGSTLRASAVTKSDGRASTTVTLEHPPGLYQPVFLKGLAEAFGVAIELSRGRETSCVPTEFEDGYTNYKLSWTR